MSGKQKSLSGKKSKKVIYLIPSLVTFMNLLIGFYSLILVVKGQVTRAIVLLFLAGFLDFFDGRIARFTQTSTAFGKELDSLADLISFGVAPAFLLYQTSLYQMGKTGWLLPFFFLACGAIRLARFNILPAKLSKKYFLGLPIPASAGNLLLLWYLFPDALLLHVLSLFFLGLLMISPFPYPSFKSLNISSHHPTLALLILLLLLFIAFHYPIPTLLCLGLIYLSLGPLSFIRLYLLEKRSASIEEGLWDEY